MKTLLLIPVLAAALLCSCQTRAQRQWRLIEREITGPLPDPGPEAIEALFREQ